MTPRGTARPTGRLRLVLVGAGNMGRKWMRVIRASESTELAGVVDLDVKLASRALSEEQFSSVAVGAELEDVAREASVDAVINVTVPQAHHSVSTAAMFLGLPVLSEKPIAPTVAEALSLAATSELTGRLIMASQSRRYFNALRRFRHLAARIGPVEILATQFFKAPHFGGFRDEMDDPLLVDMAIHPFDVARYLLDDEPVSVDCRSFNPSWSWYRGAAAAEAGFEFRNGAKFSYLGSWCSPGLETTWNGQWRASGPDGSATWDGDSEVRAATALGPISDEPDIEADSPEEIAGALAEFVEALRTGAVPSDEIHSNIMSLAMVEGAVLSSRAHRVVSIDEVFERALSHAIGNETLENVRTHLAQQGASFRNGRRHPVSRP